MLRRYVLSEPRSSGLCVCMAKIGRERETKREIEREIERERGRERERDRERVGTRVPTWNCADSIGSNSFESVHLPQALTPHEDGLLEYLEDRSCSVKSKLGSTTHGPVGGTCLLDSLKVQTAAHLFCHKEPLTGLRSPTCLGTWGSVSSNYTRRQNLSLAGQVQCMLLSNDVQG